MSIHAVVYSSEDKSPEFIALYTDVGKAEIKFKDIVNYYDIGELSNYHSDKDNILITDNDVISISLQTIHVEEILSQYYTVLYRQLNIPSKIMSLHKTLEEATHYVENDMNHNCTLNLNYNVSFPWFEPLKVWDNDDVPYTIISIHKYTVE